MPSTALGMRNPAEHTIASLLEVQASEPARSWWARLFGASPIGSESEPLFTRALGELRVAEELAQLDHTWIVLHSVRVGSEGACLDHLVIGLAGLFTITTRNYPGQTITVAGRSVVIDGMKIAHVRTAEHDLGSAERRLSAAMGITMTVSGLLVFVESSLLTLSNGPKDIQVLRANELVPWLEAQAEVFDENEVTRIATVAERVETWGIDPSQSTESMRGQFDYLLLRVARARVRRQLWFGAATVGIIVAATALATLVIMGMFSGGHTQ